MCMLYLASPSLMSIGITINMQEMMLDFIVEIRMFFKSPTFIKRTQ
jgi:hypothetical protein